MPFACLVVAVGLVGCFGLDVGPGLLVNQAVLASGEALDDDARVVGGSGTVQAFGNIVGRLPCDNVGADVKVRSGRIDLVVTMTSGVNACSGIPPTTFNYIVNVFNVKSGTYDVTVEHQHQGIDRPDGIVLTETIEVN